MSHDNYSLSARYTIISGMVYLQNIAKGDELKEKNIGDELGVSRTPVGKHCVSLSLRDLCLSSPIRERSWRVFPRTISGIYTR
ncbi:MAG: hypothetical protein ACLRI8_12435 [Agathobacter rectalis]